MAENCPHCGAVTSSEHQECRHRYDHIDLPPIRPVVTRIELFGGRCGTCSKRYRAAPPANMVPGTPFGPRIHVHLLYLHYSHHIGIERLSRVFRELFGLCISEGAIINSFRRVADGLESACEAIRKRLRTSRVIASDETTTRVKDRTQWQWVFIGDDTFLHTIAPSRARSVAQDVLGGHPPRCLGLGPLRRAAGTGGRSSGLSGPCVARMSSTPSIAAIQGLLSDCGRFCAEPSGSASDDAHSRIRPWPPTRPGPNVISMRSCVFPPLIQRGRPCNARSRRGASNSFFS